MNIHLYKVLLDFISLIIVATFSVSLIMYHLKAQLFNVKNILISMMIFIMIFLIIIKFHFMYYLLILIFSFCILFDTYKCTKNKS